MKVIPGGRSTRGDNDDMEKTNDKTNVKTSLYYKIMIILILTNLRVIQISLLNI